MLILENLTPKTARIINTDDDSVITVPAEDVSARIGDAVVLRNSIYICDESRTIKRREHIYKLENTIWAQDHREDPGPEKL